MTRSARWASVVAASVLAALPLVAQEGEGMGSYSNPVALGVFAGASIPTGAFSDFAASGWHIGALLQWSSPTAPIGVRADGAYHKFGDKNDAGIFPSLLNATLDGTLTFSTSSTVRPYILAGGGVYSQRARDQDSQTKFGVNGGIGILVPLSGFSTMIEGRYHIIFDKTEGTSNSAFIPISVGLMFR